MTEGQPAPSTIPIPENAASDDLRFGNAMSVAVLRCGIAISFLITLFVSRKLWLSTRDYPLTPVWSGIPQPYYPFDHILFWIMAVALLGVALLPNPRVALKVVCVVGVVWAILDQSRWQPYFILFMAMLACLLVLPFEKRRPGSPSQMEWALLPIRLLVAFTYIYSGLQKFNVRFQTNVFPWMLAPLHRMIHFDVNSLNGRWIAAMALGAAAVEALGGALLLFRRTRRPAALFLVAMHCFILLMIGPFGYRWNAVVWPWNVAMILVLWALFWRRQASSWPTPNLISRGWWREAIKRSPFLLPAVLFLFGVMPILSFFGRWDSYLSFSLYSGALCDCEIQIDPEDYARMPPAARKATEADSGLLDLTDWTTAELGAMPYPEHRIALNVCKSLARRARHGPVLIQLGSKPNLLNGRREYQYFSFPPGGGPPRKISAAQFNGQHNGE